MPKAAWQRCPGSENSCRSQTNPILGLRNSSASAQSQLFQLRLLLGRKTPTHTAALHSVGVMVVNEVAD